MIIEKACLFQDLSPQFKERVAGCLTRESVPPGAHLFRMGDPADYLFILEHGRVRLSYGAEGNLALVVSASGDAFGWSSLLDRKAYTATAECLDPTTVTKIRREDIAALFASDPASGLAFYRRLSGMIGERLMSFYKLIPAEHGAKKAAPGF